MSYRYRKNKAYATKDGLSDGDGDDTCVPVLGRRKGFSDFVYHSPSEIQDSTGMSVVVVIEEEYDRNSVGKGVLDESEGAKSEYDSNIESLTTFPGELNGTLNLSVKRPQRGNFWTRKPDFKGSGRKRQYKDTIGKELYAGDSNSLVASRTKRNESKTLILDNRSTSYGISEGDFTKIEDALKRDKDKTRPVSKRVERRISSKKVPLKRKLPPILFESLTLTVLRLDPKHLGKMDKESVFGKAKHSYDSVEEYIRCYRQLIEVEMFARVAKSIREVSSRSTYLSNPISFIRNRHDDTCVLSFELDKKVFDLSGIGWTGLSNRNLFILQVSYEDETAPIDENPVDGMNPSCRTIIIERFGVLERAMYKTSDPTVIEFDIVTVLDISDQHTMVTLISAEWKLNYLMDLNTYVKMNDVLMNVREYHLCNQILSPDLNEMISFDNLVEIDGNSLFSRLKSRYNESQRDAIATAAYHKSGFTLIRGPPGTGKTHTILGILSVLLSCGYVTLNRSQLSKSKHIIKQTVNTLASKGSGVVIVATQSNAAISELTARLHSEGLIRNDVLHRELRMVRVGIGQQDVVDPELKQYNLVELIKSKRNRDKKKEILHLKQEIMSLDSKSKVSVTDSFKKKQLMNRLKILEKRMVNHIEGDINSEDSRRTYENALGEQILLNADVILSTIAGTSELQRYFPHGTDNFEIVITDESSQAFEVTTLIPFQFGCKYCIMVGDQKQLGPVLSFKEDFSENFPLTMFSRVILATSKAPCFLDLQYRMDPLISAFVSSHFYDGRLRNSPTVSSRNIPDFLRSRKAIPYLGPFCCYDITSSTERMVNSSYLNDQEISLIQVLITLIVKLSSPKQDIYSKIGVITPYREQKMELRRAVYSRGIDFKDIAIDTVDGFQGREKDIVIFSSVRSNSTFRRSGKETIGFLADLRRLCVSLSRAKFSLIIVGNERTLKSNPDFLALINHMNDKKLRKNPSTLHENRTNQPNPL